ncbi:MAG TPA: nucleoside/nucleotide kinase family protein [Rhodoglobus sp.]|nr:nucleoside/nucleotide kinase family protein [Rhodoglobus sp.]HQI65520.1 nucleoside/nucleotide kinase family protein [Rhodoglobus sp.]
MSTLRSIESLAQFVESLPTSPRRIIGIAGSPGAGKSTIAEALVARLRSAVVLPMDGYHLPQARLVELGRRDRMGAPDTFDVDGFLATLSALRAVDNSGNPVLAPGFDRGIEEPVPDAIRILQELSTVVVEGNYLLLESGGWGRVAPMLDATVFVQVDRGIRLDRLIERHERFGKSPADARAWALGPDERNAQLIEATATRADRVVELP